MRSQLALGSFYGLSDEEIDVHCGIKRYNNFVLTGAVFPSYDLQIVPVEGFRYSSTTEFGEITRLIEISASSGNLFGLFMDLVELVSDPVELVLMASHNQEVYEYPEEFWAEHIDGAVGRSTFLEFEALLTEDGCLGVMARHPQTGFGVALDEHKLIIVQNYGPVEKQVLAILKNYRIPEIEDLKLICHAEHIHSTSDRLRQTFERFTTAVGADRDYHS